MAAGTRRWIQIFLAAMLLAAGARLLWIFYQRRRPLPQKPPAPTRTLHPDYFVHLPGAYVTDFQGAQRLKGTVVWVRDGYRYAHFPFDAGSRRTRRMGDPPLLAPIEKITIQDVLREPAGKRGVDQVNIVFESPGAEPPTRSLTVGFCERPSDSCRFYVDEIFFMKDPRQLYNHWTAEDWRAIEGHEAKPGMSETQVSFALGFGRTISGTNIAGAGERTTEFRPPGRAPVVVTFGADGRARRIQ